MIWWSFEVKTLSTILFLNNDGKENNFRESNQFHIQWVVFDNHFLTFHNSNKFLRLLDASENLFCHYGPYNQQYVLAILQQKSNFEKFVCHNYTNTKWYKIVNEVYSYIHVIIIRFWRMEKVLGKHALICKLCNDTSYCKIL